MTGYPFGDPFASAKPVKSNDDALRPVPAREVKP
jgi:hypothetical protein